MNVHSPAEDSQPELLRRLRRHRESAAQLDDHADEAVGELDRAAFEVVTADRHAAELRATVALDDALQLVQGSPGIDGEGAEHGAAVAGQVGEQAGEPLVPAG